jgi:proteasome accessory factor A
MRHRITGIENEYGIMLYDEKHGFRSTHTAFLLPHTNPSDMLKAVLRNASLRMRDAFYVDSAQNTSLRVEERGYGVSQNRLWLPNGGCIYIDVGRPEHASPEAISALDTVIYNKAGELICADVFDTIGVCKEGDPDRQIVLIKNNTDYGSSPQGFGCHENYSVYHVDFEKNPNFTAYMLPFLITRQIFGGAGWHNPDGLFVYSQRTPFILSETSQYTQQQGTTGFLYGANTQFASTNFNSRAILNTKWTVTNTLASGESVRRLHLIMGDANMLEFALFLNFGTTALVLSMFEDKVRLNLKITNAVTAMHKISAQMDYRSPLIEKAGGGRISALHVQFAYLEAAEMYITQTEFESEAQKAESVRVLKLWRETLEALRDENYQWLEGRIDWVTKKRIIEDYLGRKNIADSEKAIAKARELSLAYHIITPPFDGIWQFVKRKWPECRLLTDDEIIAGKNIPPQNTRALLRSRFIRLAKWVAQNKNHADYKRLMVDWEHVVYKDTPIELKDPFSVENEDLEMLLQEMA